MEQAASEGHLVTDMQQPAHAIRLPGSTWSLWQWVAIRGAGFPIEQVLRLASSFCATAADQLLEAEQNVQQVEEQAATIVNAALDTLRHSDQWHDAPQREPLVKLLRMIRKGKVPSITNFSSEIVEAVAAFRGAQEQVAAARVHYQAVYQTGVRDISAAIREIAHDHQFQEAVIWQNRQAYHTAVLRLQRSDQSAPRSSRQRQHEELIASYVQRYSAKNDTIGFFGPLGWARITPDQPGITVQAGPSLLATRNVYFDGWSIDALAQALAQNPALLPWLRPRRMPILQVEGTTLHLPFAPSVPLSPGQAALLQACDGTRPAQEIATVLLQNPRYGFRSEQDVYKLLKNLVTLRRIAWTLEVSCEGEHPEQALRQLLVAIGDQDLRQAGLQALAELEEARQVIVRAAGDAAALDRALEQMEATFTRLAHSDATRRAGKTYGGRTLVYEDCRRDITIELGGDVLQQLGQPLELLLTSARWFTYTAAKTYQQAFKEIYTALAQKAQSSTVSFANFWLWAQPLLFGEKTDPADAVATEFQQRWIDILKIPAGQRQVAYSSAELQSQVAAVFAAPGPGWQSARFHSPDVMLAATTNDAILRGDYQFVMGEFHQALNTLSCSLFLSQHPNEAELFQALEADVQVSRVIPAYSKEWPAPTGRVAVRLISPKDFRLLFAYDSCGIDPAQALPIGELVLEERGDRLVVQTRDGDWEADLLEVAGEFLTAGVVDRLKIVPAAEHTPRVSFDRLVVCRESWSFAASDIPFAQAETEAEQFLAARRWMQVHHMPRFVFTKVPVEEKPVYLDFNSPIYINLIAKLVRRCIDSNQADGRIVISEMLPSPDHVWLPDAQGQCYTCEFRVVAVDPTLPPVNDSSNRSSS